MHRFSSLALKSRIAADFGLFPGKSLQRFPSLPLKSRIDVAFGLFPGKSLHRFASLALKSRIAARRRANPGHSLQRLPNSPPEIRNRCSRGVVAFCRRNHSPLRRRRLVSDANVVAVTPAAGGTITPVCLRRHLSGDMGVARRVSAPQKKEPLTCVRGSLRCGRDSNSRPPA